MSSVLSEWRYSASHDCPRLSYLEKRVPFKSLVERTQKEISVLCAHRDRCRDKDGYFRVVFCVRAGAELFDILFNSAFGLRAAYFRNPQCGLDYNRRLLAAIAPQLVTWAESNCAELDPGFVEKSLIAESAKTWLTEPGLDFCKSCKAEWHSSAPYEFEIINGRWETDNHVHSQWGRRAYSFENLRLIGAFLNNRGDQYVAPHKIDRAEQIAKRGWS